jgi:3-deoxy-D-manno-octulosonic-acid transferase/heptosyltransferase-1
VETREILIVKLSSIGDVVHTLPSLEALYRLDPQAHITWLVEEEASQLIQGHTFLSRVMVSKRKRWVKQLRKPVLWLQTVKEIIRFVTELRSVNYDLVIDFQGLFKSGLLVFLCRGKRKVGFDNAKEMSFLFLTERYPVGLPEQHALEKNLTLVKSLSGSIDQSGIPYKEHSCKNIVTNEKEKRKVDEFLRKHEIVDEKPLLAVHPMARWETKLWDVHKFARLSDQLIKDYNAQIVFTGQKQDAPVITKIISLMNRPAVNASGETSLKELAYLLERSQLIITTDSGPMHIAAAMGTPVVALFGPTAPWRTGPYSKSAEIVRNDLYCSPCFKKHCSHISCMKGITVEDVLKAVDSRLLMKKTDRGITSLRKHENSVENERGGS